jgi:hypothetical protein
MICRVALSQLVAGLTCPGFYMNNVFMGTLYMALFYYFYFPVFRLAISHGLDLIFFFYKKKKVGLIKQARWCYIFACETTNSHEEGYDYLNVRDYGS